MTIDPKAILNLIPGMSWLRLLPGLIILALVFTVTLEHRQNVKLKAQVVELTTLRKADRASYEAAQKQAADLNKAQVANVEAKQKDISENVKSQRDRDLDWLRANNKRLRDQAASTPQSAAHSPTASQATPAPGSAGPDLCVPSAASLSAQEIELNANAWVAWYRQLQAAK